jgi:hypothetical protein
MNRAPILGGPNPKEIKGCTGSAECKPCQRKQQTAETHEWVDLGVVDLGFHEKVPQQRQGKVQPSTSELLMVLSRAMKSLYPKAAALLNHIRPNNSCMWLQVIHCTAASGCLRPPLVQQSAAASTRDVVHLLWLSSLLVSFTSLFTVHAG